MPSEHRSRSALGVAAAILYVFLWASAFVPSRILARGAPPLTILAIRFILAGGLLFAGVWAARLPVPRDGPTWLRLFAVGLGGNALYLGLSYEALRHMSAGMGSIVASTNPLILAVLARRPHPEQGFRTCLGVLRLFRGIETARAEAVSTRAVEIGVLSYASVASILKHRLDQKAAPQAADGTLLLHDNIRGSDYFH